MLKVLVGIVEAMEAMVKAALSAVQEGEGQKDIHDSIAGQS